MRLKHYPWQSKQWDRLLANLERMPHALLLGGPKGVGKRDFARALAARLLCEGERTADSACGKCIACRWFAAGTHPDLRVLAPEAAEVLEAPEHVATETPATKQKKASNQIVIDQVRQLQDFIGLGTHRRGWRLILIEPAEAMNPPSANAVLKLLEEPTPSTLFILVSNQPKQLPATLRSRCQAVVFGRPDAQHAEAWLRAAGIADPRDALALAGGYPLLAASLIALDAQREQFVAAVAAGSTADPLQLAARWEAWARGGSGAVTLAVLVEWLQRWLYDLVAYKLAGRVVYHPRQRQSIAALAQGARVEALIACYNELLRLRRVAEHPLNARLFIEDMLLRYLHGVAVA